MDEKPKRGTMILQNIIFPGKETLTNTEKLYYRITPEGNPLYRIGSPDENYNRSFDTPWLKAGTRMDLDTYFNSFSVGVWRKITGLQSLALQFYAEGSFYAEIVHKKMEDGTIREKCISKIHGCEKQETIFTIPIQTLPSEGMLYLRITAGTEGLKFYGGAWTTGRPPFRKTKLYVVICTYKKEADIDCNMRLLKRAFLENKDNERYEKIQVCIIDNGGTLTPVKKENYQIIKNKNNGGSGGFTRGIRQALTEKTATGITHILLIDDDVRIEPDILFRTCSLVSYLKEEHRGRFLGGAMLRRDYPYIQHEAGGVWNNGRIHSLHKGIDLREPAGLLKNELPELRHGCKVKPDYAAWWYCCIPAEFPKEHGMPMPFFVHCDDIEYSLRSKEEPIFINGIGVWHEEFEQKRSSAMEYYDVRNMLITNTLFGRNYNGRKAAIDTARKVAGALTRYRYKDAELIFKAIKDFLNGPGWFYEQDGEELHHLLIESGYWLETIEKFRMKKPAAGDTKAFYHSKQNSWRDFVFSFLPVWDCKTYAIPIGSCLREYRGKKRLYLYEPVSGKGFLVYKSWRKLLWILWKLFWAELNLLIGYRGCRRKFLGFHKKPGNKK